MINVLIYSQNEVFLADLENQIKRFVEDVSFGNEKPDIVIVDENSGQYDVLREKYPMIPLIFLSSLKKSNSPNNLNIFIKKPLVLDNLLDSIKSANHRLDNSQEGFLLFNQYELRPSKKEIFDTVSQKNIKLTEKEVSILKYLYKNKDKFVDKTDLQTNVWLYNEEVNTHTIETHIYRLRQKVEKYSKRKLILTESGQYKLCMSGGNG